MYRLQGFSKPAWPGNLEMIFTSTLRAYRLLGEGVPERVQIALLKKWTYWYSCIYSLGMSGSPGKN